MGSHEWAPMGSQEGRHGIPRGVDEGPLAAQRATAGAIRCQGGVLGNPGGSHGIPQGRAHGIVGISPWYPKGGFPCDHKGAHGARVDPLASPWVGNTPGLPGRSLASLPEQRAGSRQLAGWASWPADQPAGQQQARPARPAGQLASWSDGQPGPRAAIEAATEAAIGVQPYDQVTCCHRT